MTIAFAFRREADMEKLEPWIQELLWEKRIDGEHMDIEILRMKGLINDSTSQCKVILQGVRELYDKHQGEEWGTEERINRIVLIGKSLNAKIIRDSFERTCIKQSS
jgi:G3E family GTPase